MKNNIDDPDPLIRAAAAGSFAIMDVNQRFDYIKHLLQDSVRLVRISTAQSLADVSLATLSASDKALLNATLEEYKQTQYINADHGTAHLNLGVIALHQGDHAEAEKHYKKAIEIEPLFPYSYINLADLYRTLGRENEAQQTLLSALNLNPDLAEIHHALGLSYVRQRQLDKALEHLKKAAGLAPHTARFAYVYAIGLHSQKKSQDALAVLQDALERFPYDRDILFSLASINRDLGQIEIAHEHAVKLVDYFPEDPNYQQFEQQLRIQIHNE